MRDDYKKHAQAGFTLVELGIVLIIVGILSAGVLFGQDMIRRAEVQSIIIEARTYQTAAENFRSQYGALPGDKFDAASTWATATNGDGDGIIDTPTIFPNSAAEPWQFWLHLQLDNELPIRVTGTNDGGPGFIWTPGVNVPPSKVESVGWFVGFNLRAYTQAAYDFNTNHFFVASIPGDNIAPFQPFLTPGETLSIDTKVDDAEPATGNVVALWWDDQCSDSDDEGDFEADYRAFDETRQCAVAFINQFQN